MLKSEMLALYVRVGFGCRIDNHRKVEWCRKYNTLNSTQKVHTRQKSIIEMCITKTNCTLNGHYTKVENYRKKNEKVWERINQPYIRKINTKAEMREKGDENVVHGQDKEEKKRV